MPEEPRAETVGSLLRAAEVVQAARSGRDDPAAGKVLDEAVLEAVRLQEDAGLDVITDGEVRRHAWAQTTRFLDCFEATPGRGVLNWRGGAADAAVPAAPAAGQRPDAGPQPATGGGYPAV